MGTSSSIPVNGGGSALQVEGTTAPTSRISVINRGNNTDGGGIQIAKSRGTQPALVQDDDQVGGIFFAAGDANDFVSQPAKIECFIDGAPSGSDTPGRLTFSTCPDQTDTPVERMRITSSGNIGIGKDPTTSYGRNLQIHSTGTNGAAIHLTDASTGGSSSDGFHLVNTNSGNVYLGPYWEWYIKGWYQGSWFIRNPIKRMLRSDFKKLVKKINKTISQKYPKDRDNGPLFTGETYSEMYPQLVKCMDEIIELFKSETGNNNWSYDEGIGESIKSKLKRGDKFVENWNQRLAALKSY